MDGLLLPSPVSPIFDCAVAEVTACTKLENEEPNDRRPNAGLEVDGDGGGVGTDFCGTLKSLKLSPSPCTSVSVDVDSTRGEGDAPFRLGVDGGVSIAGAGLSRFCVGGGAASTALAGVGGEDSGWGNCDSWLLVGELSTPAGTGAFWLSAWLWMRPCSCSRSCVAACRSGCSACRSRWVTAEGTEFSVPVIKSALGFCTGVSPGAGI